MRKPLKINNYQQQEGLFSLHFGRISLLSRERQVSAARDAQPRSRSARAPLRPVTGPFPRSWCGGRGCARTPCGHRRCSHIRTRPPSCVWCASASASGFLSFSQARVRDGIAVIIATMPRTPEADVDRTKTCRHSQL